MDNLSKALCIINRGLQKKYLSVEVEKSRLIVDILKCLEKVGYIRGYIINSNKVKILFIYRGDIPLIRAIIRISKSTRRQYVSHKWFKNKFDRSQSYIISSSAGVCFYSNLFLNSNPPMGGEILLKIS